MSQIIDTSKCGNCYHGQEVHVDGVCKGDLTCLCSKFIPNDLYQFAYEVEAAKLKIKAIKKRCQFILEKIPQTRNASDKSFAKIYWEVWHGFKIRKGNPSVMTTDTWKRLPSADNINRMKRLVKQHNDDLKTYDPEMIKRQEVMYQAVLEFVTDN